MKMERVEALPYALSKRGGSLAGNSTRAGLPFERIFLAYYTRIVAILFRLSGDRTRAEELANEVFWRAYRQSSSRAVEGNIGGWLYRTATNLGIEDLRSTARRQRYERAAGHAIGADGTSPNPLDKLLKEEKRAQVQAVLASLKKWQAQLLILRSGGLSYEELAAALVRKKSSVGTMLARAEAEFHKRYFQTYGREE
jgi:RNA polymerase sigma-70 factor (ECF subfamily)